MLPFLSLITGKSGVHLVKSPIFPSNQLLALQVQGEDNGMHPERGPFLRESHFPAPRLAAPHSTQGVNGHRAPTATIASRHWIIGFTFYGSHWPCRLGQWHNRTQEIDERSTVNNLNDSICVLLCGLFGTCTRMFLWHENQVVWRGWEENWGKRGKCYNFCVDLISVFCYWGKIMAIKFFSCFFSN